MSQVVLRTAGVTTRALNTATENEDEAMEIEDDNATQRDVEINTQTNGIEHVEEQNEPNVDSQATQQQQEISIATPQPAEPSIRSRLVEEVVESPDDFRDETKVKASKRAKPKSPEKSPIKSPFKDDEVSLIFAIIMICVF